VPLWVPEIGGPIDPDSEAHNLIMSIYAGISKAERHRIQVRVRAAMTAQTEFEGRFLGGRPPYGYRLADAGPHPNPQRAAAGGRLHRLALDPLTAAVVRRIFMLRLDGLGAGRIAVTLNADRVPCPSAHDRARNSHRSALLIRAVAASQNRSDLEMIDVPRALAEQGAMGRSMGLTFTYQPDIPALVTVVRGESIIITT
jgi:hypothetical protein